MSGPTVEGEQKRPIEETLRSVTTVNTARGNFVVAIAGLMPGVTRILSREEALSRVIYIIGIELLKEAGGGKEKQA